MGSYNSYLYVTLSISDPFETVNKFSSLSEEEKRVLNHVLGEMIKCKGRECNLPRPHHPGQGRSDIGGQRGNKRKNGEWWEVFNNLVVLHGRFD